MKEGRKTLTKKQRLLVYDKCGGRCAYCGRKIEYKDMQVDHLESVYIANIHGKEVDNELKNLMPACRMCNFYKSTMGIDKFRQTVKSIPERLEKSFIFRLARQYGLVTVHDDIEIMFYFEVLETKEILAIQSQKQMEYEAMGMRVKEDWGIPDDSL